MSHAAGNQDFVKLLDNFFNFPSAHDITLEQLRFKQKQIFSEQAMRLVACDKENSTLLKRKRAHLVNCISSRAAIQDVEDSFIEKSSLRIQEINNFVDKCMSECKISNEDYENSKKDLIEKLNNLKSEYETITSEIASLERQEERYYQIQSQYELSKQVEAMKKEEATLKETLASLSSKTSKPAEPAPSGRLALSLNKRVKMQ